MNDRNSKHKSAPSAPEESTRERLKKIERIKDILQLLSKCFSQMKIFRPDHANVKKFTSQIFAQLDSFLDTHWKLELAIKETSFLFDGDTVYSDRQLSRSLPFLFFKDGMQGLFFYKGLSEKEFLDFLEMIKRDSELPPDESDIVMAMWEKEFANIRYYAPDDFLESKIGMGMETLDYDVDPETLFSGKIELSPEDENALKAGLPLIGANSITESAGVTAIAENEEDFESEEGGILLSKEEQRVLETMLENNRSTPLDKELISLLFEMLYLEERPEQFQATLNILEQCHKDLLKKDAFDQALNILVYIEELSAHLPQDAVQNQEALSSLLHRFKSRDSMSHIMNIYREGAIEDLKSFISYIRRFGKISVPVLAELYEGIKAPSYKRIAADFLEEFGKEDPASIVNITSNERPMLTREIIRILGRSKNRNIIPYLVQFLAFPDEDIKSSAAESLGNLSDPNADKVLVGMLTNRSEELRLMSIQNLRPDLAPSLIPSVFSHINDKSFIKKSPAEKKAYFDFLGRSSSPEASAILSRTAKKANLLSRRRTIDTSLMAVEALIGSSKPEAEAALVESSHSPIRKISQRARQALRTRKKGLQKTDRNKDGS